MYPRAHSDYILIQQLSILAGLNINSADLESLMQPLLSQISVGPLTAAVQASGILARYILICMSYLKFTYFF